MSWEAIGAIAGILGTVLTFISILIQRNSDKQRSISKNRKAEEYYANDKIVDASSPFRASNFEEKHYQISKYDFPFSSDDQEKTEASHHDPYRPFLYYSVGLIAACGGVASILVPWLLLQASPEFECLLFPLVLFGIVGGIIFALVIDNYFEMYKAKATLRFPLSLLSGLIGGWLGLIVVFGFIGYLALSYQGGGYVSPRKGSSLEEHEEKIDTAVKTRYRKEIQNYNLPLPDEEESSGIRFRYPTKNILSDRRSTSRKGNRQK